MFFYSGSACSLPGDAAGRQLPTGCIPVTASPSPSAATPTVYQTRQCVVGAFTTPTAGIVTTTFMNSASCSGQRFSVTQDASFGVNSCLDTGSGWSIRAMCNATDYLSSMYSNAGCSAASFGVQSAPLACNALATNGKPQSIICHTPPSTTPTMTSALSVGTSPSHSPSASHVPSWHTRTSTGVPTHSHSSSHSRRANPSTSRTHSASDTGSRTKKPKR